MLGYDVVSFTLNLKRFKLKKTKKDIRIYLFILNYFRGKENVAKIICTPSNFWSIDS